MSGADTVLLAFSASSEKDSTISYEDFLQVVTGLSPKRADSRDDWVGNVKGIKYVGQCNKFTSVQILTLADSFSKLQPDKYESDADLKLVSEEVGHHGKPKTLGSFIYYLKEDNPELHNKIFNKLLPYNQVKKEFEKSFFKVVVPLVYVEVERTGKLEMKSRKDFINAYENKWCGMKVLVKGFWEEQQKQFVPLWLQDSSMRTYRRLEFCPPPKVLRRLIHTTSSMASRLTELQSHRLALLIPC